MCGIPLGIWLFQFAPETIVTRVMGAVLILYSTYCLLTPTLPLLQPGFSTWLFGFVAGILGGAYNTSGPPIVIYGTLTRWQPERFLATLQPYFLLTSAAAAGGQWAAGLWTDEVLRLLAWSLPAVAAGLFISERLNLRISTALFNRIIYSFLLVTGALFFVCQDCATVFSTLIVAPATPLSPASWMPFLLTSAHTNHQCSYCPLPGVG